MKKTTRNLLILLAVLAVLGGAAAALFFTRPAPVEEEKPASSSSVTQVMGVARDDVKDISVKNAAGGFQLVAFEGETQTEFTLGGYEKHLVDTDAAGVVAASLISVWSTKTVGPQEDLEGFGLTGEQAVVVTIRKKDGTGEVLTIGGKAPESIGRYIMKDQIVYITYSIDERLDGDIYPFFVHTVYEEGDNEKNVLDSEGNVSQEKIPDVLDEVLLSGANFPQDIRLVADADRAAGYLITEPFVVESGSSKFGEMMESLKTVTADAVVAAGVTEELLTEYGLDEPFASISFTYNGNLHRLAVSAADSEKNRFMIADDTDLIYKIAAETVAPWAEATLMGLRSPYILLPSVRAVKKLTLTTASGTEEILLERSENGDSGQVVITARTAAGQALDYDACYQPFYYNLLSLSVLSMDKAAAHKNAPTLRVEYEYFDDSRRDVIEFYPEGSDRYSAELNGLYNGLLRRNSVERILEMIPDLAAGKTIEKLS